MALRDIEIRALRPQARVYKRADANGLFLEIHPSGSKLWRFKYRQHDKDKRIALGRYPEVGLSEARRLRDEVRRKVWEGGDPVTERRHAKLVAKFNAANTFGEVATEYIDKTVAEGRAVATICKANWLLEQLSPLANCAIADLKPVEVLAALKRIDASGRHETAARCRSFASRVFRYAVATGRGETDPTSVLRGALTAPKACHHAAIVDPVVLGALLREVDRYGGSPVTRLAMQILPHVMSRPGELRFAQWREFDLEAAVWKIPQERMKMRRPHAVPLSRQVLARLDELRQLTGEAGFAFPAYHSSRKPQCENTINQAFRRMGFAKGVVTAHGLRTTASTLLNESGRWSADAIERSLAHADANAVRGIYNRGSYWDERVSMHQWWSDYLDDVRDDDASASPPG